jgi:aryl-alcohol dehydrogenase-like predicted oxidoreductase
VKTVVLGHTGLEVTPTAYGTRQFGGDWGFVDETSAMSAIAHAREPASALRDLVTERLIRHGGVTNFSSSQMDLARLA